LRGWGWSPSTTACYGVSPPLSQMPSPL
jgi:hypothetical protein